MDFQNMDIQISRSGFYTVTFENTSCMSEKEIRNELSTVGEVCAVILKKNRVFIRYRHKEEAQRALAKYGKILKLHVAFNSKPSYKAQQSVGEEEEDEEEEDLKDCEKKKLSATKSKISESNIDSENVKNSKHEDKNFCLILSNLPKKYLFKDVRALIEETKPLWVELDETKVFNIRFAYVILDSLQKVTYLIEKLNGFVICGEKLGAVEANKLLKWRYDGRRITS